MKVIFAGGWRGRWEGRLRVISHWEFLNQHRWSGRCCPVHRLPPSSLMPLLTTLRNFFWLAVRLRNSLHPLPAERLPVPVVSIGNITVGGTGKTPLTQWIVGRLKRQGYQPAILMPPTPYHDEAQEHTRAGFPVYIGRDRVASAQRAIAEGATALVLDDGFQYRRLHRDVDIVLWDATAWLHPLNPLLRQPIDALRLADAIVLSRADALDKEHLTTLYQRFARCFFDRKLLAGFATEPAQGLLWRQGAPIEMAAPSLKRVIIATGIGNPFYFAFKAQQAGYEVAALIAFPDHHQLTSKDAAFVVEVARQEDAVAVLTTRKDAIKWGQVWRDQFPLLVLSAELRWLWGQEELWQGINAKLSHHAMAAVEG